MILKNEVSGLYSSVAMFLALAAVLGAASTSSGREGHQGVLPGIRPDPCDRRCTPNSPSMIYKYYLPSDYDPSQDYPLLLALHGAGHWSGNIDDLVNGPNFTDLIDQTDVNFPAILVVPQLPNPSSWQPGSDNDRTDEILDRIIAEYSVDLKRLYVTGFSLGGYGTWSYLDAYNIEGLRQGASLGGAHLLSYKFAAGAPAAGGLSTHSIVSEYAALEDTAIWIANGARDSTIPPEYGRESFHAVTGNLIYDPQLGYVGPPIVYSEFAAGGPTAVIGNKRYTEYPLADHQHTWRGFWAETDFYEWMFSQSLAIPEPSCLMLATSAALCFTGRHHRQPSLS